MRFFLLYFWIWILTSLFCFCQDDVEFWFGAPNFESRHGDNPIYLVLTTQAFDASIVIDQPANPLFTPIRLYLPPNTTQQVDLTAQLAFIESRYNSIVNGQTGVNNSGLHITSSSPIKAYYDERGLRNPEIFALKGRNALGTEFYTVFQKDSPNGTKLDKYYDAHCEFIIVATEDSTEVTITPTVDLYLSPTANRPANVPFTIRLNKGQSFVGAPRMTPGTDRISKLAQDHPSGTYIVTNGKKVAVTLSDDSVEEQSCRDAYGDQTIPVHMTGQEYIVMRGQANAGLERVCIVATNDNEQIFINGSYQATLNKGQMYRYTMNNDYIHVRSKDSGIYVMQIAGKGCEMGEAILPSISGCTGSFEVVFARVPDNQEIYLNIMVRKGAEGSFLLNGVATPYIVGSMFQTVPGTTDWVALRTANLPLSIVKNGTNVLTNTKDLFHLGLIVFNGSTTGTGYGYFSNFSQFMMNVINTTNGDDSLYACYGEPTNFITTCGMSEHNSSGLSYLWNTGDTTPFIPIIPVVDRKFYVTVTLKNSCALTARDSGVLVVNPEIFGHCYASDSLVCQYYPVQLRADGGVGYKWSNGSSSQTTTVYPPASGRYYVSVMDSVGCYDKESIFIYTKPSPVIDPGALKDVCIYDSVNLTVTGNASFYRWSTGSTTQTIRVSPLQSMYYAVTATGSNGCTKKDSVRVRVLALPQFSMPWDTIKVCPDSVHTINPNPYPLWRFRWNTGSTKSSITVSAPGTYILTVTNFSNCRNSDSVVFYNIPLPAAEAGVYNPVCVDDPPVTLIASGGVSYKWNTGASGRTITVDPAVTTVYRVTVTDVYNCKNTDTAVIIVHPNPHPVISGPDTVYQFFDSVIYSSPMIANHAYLWSISSGTVTGSPAASVRASFPMATPGQVLLSMEEVVMTTGCTGSDNKTIYVVQSPVINLTKNDISCFGEKDGNARVFVTGGMLPYHYTWSTGSSANSLSRLGQGEYSVTVSDKNGYGDTVSFFIAEPDSFYFIEVVASHNSCFGYSNGSLMVVAGGGSPPYYYEWSNGAQTNEIYDLLPGNYSLVIRDASGCEVMAATAITSPAMLQVVMDAEKPFCGQTSDGRIIPAISGGTPFSGRGDTLYNLSWSTGDSSMQLNNLFAGYYSLTVTDANGCNTAVAIQLDPARDVCLLIPNVFSPNGDGINDYWEIPFFDVLCPQARVIIWDRNGMLVFSSPALSRLWDGKLYGKVLGIDSYHYIIDMNDGSGKVISGYVTLVK